MIKAALVRCLVPGGLALAPLAAQDGGGFYGDPLTLMQGSGVAVSRSREVPSFRRVDMGGALHVTIKVGGTTSVIVTAEDNLIDLVRTEVADGTLQIGIEQGGIDFRPTLECRVAITVPALDGIIVAGSGQVDIRGLAAGQFAVSVAGRGGVHATGRAAELHVSVKGRGGAHLYDLAVEEAAVKVAGTGMVQVAPRNHLRAEVSGGGQVRFRGAPATSTDVRGSGSIQHESGAHQLRPGA
jgi:hypothetical protein